MYEDYVNEGGIVLRHRRGLDNAYNHLPSWCTEEIDIFLNNRTIEGKSESTIKNYKSALPRFCRFLVNEGLNSFSEITPSIIKRFNIQDKHKSITGKNVCNCTIRAFLIHLELRNIIQVGIHYALPGCNTSSKTIVTILNEQDRERIKIYCEKATTPLELRDAAILQLGLSSALRCVDISTLLYSEIKWTDRLLHINQSKTNVNVTLPLHTETGNAIYKYIKEGRNNTTRNPYVFLSVRGPYGKMCKRACNQALKRAGLSVTSFHILRKTCASDNLHNGMSVKETAERLGHRDTRTVHRYVSLDEEKMRECPLSLEETGLGMDGRYDYEQ